MPDPFHSKRATLHGTSHPSPSGAIRIALTGGPGAGKTIIANWLASENPEKFAAIPEAATQVYQRYNTRWDLLDDTGRRNIQREIFWLQRQQEDAIPASGDNRVFLLDRGSLDGSVYWPAGPEDYWRELLTSELAELERYDAVIWLQTCAVIGLYDGAESNACRGEASEQAVLTGQKLARAWFRHPRLYRVDAFPTVEEKVAMVRKIIETIIVRLGHS